MFYSTSVVNVPTNAPISTCLKLMHRMNVGSILVYSADVEQKLVGIFTERDLLKMVLYLQKGNHWSKGIGSIMSQPVQTLELSRIDEASELMLKYGFRHVPIVTAKGNLRSEIVGIISMRDLFRKHAYEAEKAKGKNRKWSTEESPSLRKDTFKESVGILSQDSKIQHLLSQLDPHLRFEAIDDQTIEENSELKPVFSKIVFDLEDRKASEWSHALSVLTQTFHPVHTLIFYDPHLQTQKAVETLKQLSLSLNYRVFGKPINILALSEHLHSW